MLVSIALFCATLSFCNQLDLNYIVSVLVSIVMAGVGLIFEKKHISPTVHTVASCTIGAALGAMLLPGSASNVGAIFGCVFGAGFSALAFSGKRELPQ